MSWYYNWRPYVPVAVRRKRAMKKIKKLRGKGVGIHPVEIRGRKIARTFWGEAWCDHLEKFSDYENRLPRGRSYARNGSVCHLEISEGMVRAMVIGTDLYNVDVTIKKLPKAKWRRVKARCEGRIGSLLELLRGRISRSVMAVVTDRDQGLFPLPREIGLKCDCPDWAVMCKHVAAVLYGVGARLDENPELLFLLRGVDHEELISSEAEMVAAATAGKENGRRRIAAGDLERVFGIEMAGEKPAKTGKPARRGRPTRGRRKVAGGRGRPSVAGGTQKVRGSIEKRSARSAGAGSNAAGKTRKKGRGISGLRPVTGGGVKKLRAKLKMSQSQFAALLGVSVASIGNWEKKKGRLNLQTRTRRALSRVAALGDKKASKR